MNATKFAEGLLEAEKSGQVATIDDVDDGSNKEATKPWWPDLKLGLIILLLIAAAPIIFILLVIGAASGESEILSMATGLAIVIGLTILATTFLKKTGIVIAVIAILLLFAFYVSFYVSFGLM